MVFFHVSPQRPLHCRGLWVCPCTLYRNRGRLRVSGCSLGKQQFRGERGRASSPHSSASLSQSLLPVARSGRKRRLRPILLPGFLLASLYGAWVPCRGFLDAAHPALRRATLILPIRSDPALPLRGLQPVEPSWSHAK